MDKKGSGDLFDDLFGFSKSRPSPPPRREAVDLDASIDSDDEFSLPDTPPRPTPPPATEKIKPPTQVECGAVDEGGGASGARVANVSHALSGFKNHLSACGFEIDLRAQQDENVSQRLVTCVSSSTRQR